jgi:hypothetical protein
VGIEDESGVFRGWIGGGGGHFLGDLSGSRLKEWISGS